MRSWRNNRYEDAITQGFRREDALKERIRKLREAIKAVIDGDYDKVSLENVLEADK